MIFFTNFVKFLIYENDKYSHLQLWFFSQGLWNFSQVIVKIFTKIVNFFTIGLVNFFTKIVKFFTRVVKFLIYVNDKHSHLQLWNFSQWLWIFSQLNSCSYEHIFICDCEIFHKVCEFFHIWTVVHMSICSYNLWFFSQMTLWNFPQTLWNF